MADPGSSRAFAGGLVAVVLAGVVAGAVALSRDIRISASSGDWRAVTEGFRRSRARELLGAGPRAVVHFHGPDSGPGVLSLTMSVRDPTQATHLAVRAGGVTRFSGALPPDPVRLEVEVPAGNAGVDVFLEAESAIETGSALYFVPEITLQRRSGVTQRLGQVLPGVIGLVLFVCLWKRGLRWSALSWALLAVAAATGLWMVAVDTHAALRFHPATRERLRLAAVACSWALGLSAQRSRLAAVAAILGTVGFLHGSTLGFGLVSDDFLWARPWSLNELLATAVGPEDPLGLTQGGYRPMASWSRAIDHALWGLLPEGYHLTNLALHALNGVLAWVLLGRLGLSARGALAGALGWICHPMSASSVAWLAQRTDSFMAIFFLGALALLLSPRFRTAHACAAVALAALALASKEMAVTLPLVAALVAWAALSRQEFRRRIPLLRALLLLVAGYVALWVGLFADKVVVRADKPLGWTRFDPTSVDGWVRLLPALYAPIFVPVGYAEWWTTPLREWSLAYLGLAISVVLASVWILKRCESCRGGAARVAILGAAWALATVAPVLAVPPDLYRLGLFLCLGFGLVLGALAHHAEHRSEVLAVALGAAVAVWLTPLAAASASAWGPSGFRTTSAMEWARRKPEWQSYLAPEARRLFWEQLEEREHARTWVEEDPTQAEPATEQEAYGSGRLLQPAEGTTVSRQISLNQIPRSRSRLPP